MAKKTVKIEIKPDAGIDAYWAQFNDTKIPLTNGKGSAKLDSGMEHYCIWGMIGTEGKGLEITVSTGGEKVLYVKKSKIPEGKERFWNRASFKVS